MMVVEEGCRRWRGSDDVILVVVMVTVRGRRGRFPFCGL